MAALRIREATTADAVRVAALLEELGYRRAIGDVARSLVDAGERVVVAEHKGSLVGLAAMQATRTLTHERPVARLTALVVDARRRRGGAGQALLEAVVACAREAGCEGIELTSGIRAERAEAHRFYEARGFERTSFRFWRPLDQA